MKAKIIVQGERTHPLQTYVDRIQVTVVEWVSLRPIFDVCVRETGYDGRGTLRGYVAEVCGSGESAEDHGRSDFFIGNGAAATEIWLVRRERGRVGGGEHGQRRVGARQGTLVCWDGHM